MKKISLLLSLILAALIGCETDQSQITINCYSSSVPDGALIYKCRATCFDSETLNNRLYAPNDEGVELCWSQHLAKNDCQNPEETECVWTGDVYQSNITHD